MPLYIALTLYHSMKHLSRSILLFALLTATFFICPAQQTIIATYSFSRPQIQIVLPGDANADSVLQKKLKSKIRSGFILNIYQNNEEYIFRYSHPSFPLNGDDIILKGNRFQGINPITYSFKVYKDSVKTINGVLCFRIIDSTLKATGWASYLLKKEVRPVIYYEGNYAIVELQTAEEHYILLKDPME